MVLAGLPLSSEAITSRCAVADADTMPDSLIGAIDLMGNVLRFEVDAGLLFQLGEQLVARRSIALAELIKNAYDADATKVSVSFQDVTKPDGLIIVQDNGNGMTFEDIQRGWMRVAGSQKAEKRFSPRFKRPMTGAKGVGRFATRRISRKLTICSVGELPDGSKERVIVVFDWERFQPGADLSQIPIRYRRKAVPSVTPTGVTLRLRRVRDVWEQEDAEDIRRDLLSLVTPDVSSKDTKANPTGFSIDLNSDEFPGISGEFSDFFLQSAWAKLTGSVDQKGNPQYALRRRGSEVEERFHQDRAGRYADISGVTMVIYFVVYKSGQVEGLGVRDASKYGREHGGVRLYLDGFRVFPYGQPGDDWLHLDFIRASRNTKFPETASTTLLDEASKAVRPLLAIPGNNQLFGSVFISQGEQPGLQLTMSRERLIDNNAFNQLIDFLQNGVFWLTVRYAQYLVEQRPEDHGATPTPRSTLAELERLVNEADEIEASLKNEINYRIGLARSAAETREANLIGELSLLRVLASAGTMILVFTHQLRAVVDNLARINADLRDLRDVLPSSFHAQFDNLGERLREWRTTVEDQAKQLGLLVGSDSRTQRKRLAVREVVEGVVRPLRSYTKELGINVNNHVPPYLRTPPMFEAELHAILLNLFTNALKAVRGRDHRDIVIEGEREESGITLRMSDTGVGLDPLKWEEAFRPLYSTSDVDPILGVGTGIGLTVVRDLVASYGGQARFVMPIVPFNTTIQLFFPKEV